MFWAVSTGSGRCDDPATALPDADDPGLARLRQLDRVDGARGKVWRFALFCQRFSPAREVCGADPALSRAVGGYGHDPASAVAAAHHRPPRDPR